MTAAAPETRPNILIFMTDQQCGATLDDGAHCRAKTPNLDRFRQLAASFTRAYTSSPHCCPSRTSFFTGKYASEHGVWNNVNVSNALARGPRRDMPFWSRQFKAAGYRMGFSGKWHVSNSDGPGVFGWQELLVTSATHGAGLDLESQQLEARQRDAGLYKGSLRDGEAMRRPGEIVRPGWPPFFLYGSNENPFRDADVVAAGEEFIAARAHEGPEADPWCLFVGTLGPHDPYIPPARFLDMYRPDEITLPRSFADPMADKPGMYSRTRDVFDQLTESEHREALRHYLAFCSYQDELFGRLLRAVEAAGQTENTVILYLSDHGDYAGAHGLWCKGLPSFLPAYHVPLVIAGPGVAPARCGLASEHPVSLVDLAPTLLDLAGLPAEAPMSGTSLYPWLQGEDAALKERDMFFQSNGNEAYGIQRMVLSGRWKLVHNMFDIDELYDLETDPEEMTNLLAPASRGRRVGRKPLETVPEALREVVHALYKKLWRFGLEHTDENLNPYIVTSMAPFGPGIALAD